MNEDDPLNRMFSYRDSRWLPNIEGYEVLKEQHNMMGTVNIMDEIIRWITENGFTVEEDKPVKFIERDNLWKCQLDVVKDRRAITFESCDGVFRKSEKARSREPFSIGLVDGEYYETKIHAQLALLMVLMRTSLGKNDKKYALHVEERFLNRGDIFMLTPSKQYTFKLDDENNGNKKEASPLCCFIRTAEEIVITNVEQLRFESFFCIDKVETRSSEVSKPPLVASCKEMEKWIKMKQRKQVVAQHLGARSTSKSFSAGSRGQIKLLANNWLQKTEPRSNGRASDSYWFSPKMQYRFRSTKEVECFKKCLRLCNNERDAHQMFLVEWEEKRMGKRKEEAAPLDDPNSKKQKVK